MRFKISNRPHNDSFWLLGGLAAIILYYLPSIIAGENHYMLIHDFLDSTVAHIQSMKDNGALFDNSRTMPILCGIQRSIYGSFLDIKLLIFALLPSYWAALANYILIKYTAFAGLYILLSRYVNIGKGREGLVNFATALLFASVPFYPDYGVSSAGVPLVVFAFLELYNRRNVAASMLILVYYAFFTWLVLSGVFICFAAALAILVLWKKDRRFPWLPFIGLCVLTISYVVCNYQMFITYFTPEAEPSHRFDFKVKHFTWPAFLEMLSVVLVSQYHAGLTLCIIPVVAFAIVWKRYRAENKTLDYLALCYAALVSLMVAGALVKLTMGRIRFIREFQMDRFFFLYPAMCYILGGAVLLEACRRARHRKLCIWCLAVMFLCNLAADPHIRGNIGRTLNIADEPSFKQFYDTELFTQIKQELPLDPAADRVACVGMFQAVAEYNGIYTVDGYIQMYPLSYKRKMQKVIQKELDKNASVRDYFCNWGERCYLFSAELGKHYMFSKRRQDKAIQNLEIDVEALSHLGCTYILSSVPIMNYEALGISKAGEFSNDASFWKITAYKLP